MVLVVVDKNKIDTSQMIDSFQAMLLQIEEEAEEKEKRLNEKLRQEKQAAVERQEELMEQRLKEKRKPENETLERRQKEEFSRQADDVKAFVQEDTTAKFVMLLGCLLYTSRCV